MMSPRMTRPFNASATFPVKPACVNAPVMLPPEMWEDLTRRHGEITTRWVRGVGTHHRIHEVALIDLSDEVLTILSPLTGGQDEVTCFRTVGLVGSHDSQNPSIPHVRTHLDPRLSRCHEWTT